MTIKPDQWKKISNNIDKFWNERANKVAKEFSEQKNVTIPIKSIPLCKEAKRNIQTAITEGINFLPAILEIDNLPEKIVTSIQEEILKAFLENLNYTKLTSNLYWLFHTIKDGDRVIKGQKGGNIYGTVFKDKDGILKINLEKPLKTSKEKIIKIRGGYNKIVDESFLLDWSFISYNSMTYLYNNTFIARFEHIAKDNPVYFTYHSESPCTWCKKNVGKTVRLLPRNLIKNDSDKLKDYMIKDDNTDTIIWVNKNNYRKKKKKVCAFPHTENEYLCNFELLPINIENEIYSKSKKKVVNSKNKIYEAVSPNEFKNKIIEKKEDPSLPAVSYTHLRAHET